MDFNCICGAAWTQISVSQIKDHVAECNPAKNLVKSNNDEIKIKIGNVFSLKNPSSPKKKVNVTRKRVYPKTEVTKRPKRRKKFKCVDCGKFFNEFSQNQSNLKVKFVSEEQSEAILDLKDVVKTGSNLKLKLFLCNICKFATSDKSTLDQHRIQCVDSQNIK